MALFRTAIRSGRWFSEPSKLGGESCQWDSGSRVHLQHYCLSAVSSSRVLGPVMKGNVGRAHSP